MFKLCDRHKGIGADSLIQIINTDKEVIAITIYNSNGSIASACGNVLR